MSEPVGAGRVVLDTNVLVSAVLRSGSVPSQALSVALASGTVLVSRETLEEVADVLSRPKFERYITATERDRFLSALLREAELVEVTDEVRACRDPRDDKFLSLARSGRASVIVSGDDDLLTLDPFEGIGIKTPATFLANAVLPGAGLS